MSIKDSLYEKFDEIPSRKGRGGTYQYVRWQDIADRMNSIFGTNWSSDVVYQDVIGNNVVIRVRVTVTDPETSFVSWQEGFGGAVNDDKADAGNPFKSAYSKALKDACKKWGVGLFLDEDGEVPATSSIPAGYMGKEVATPPTPTPTPTLPTGNKELKVPEGVTMNSSPVPNFMPKAPPSSNGVVPSIPVPSISVPVSSTPKVPLVPPMGMSAGKASVIKTEGLDIISDVQKVALFNILKTSGAEYEPLAREAFDANGVIKDVIPPPEQLTYQEAVHVVKYGNDKYRKK